MKFNALNLEKPDTEERFHIPGWIKNSVPVIVSALILYYYFVDQDWGKLYEAMLKANLPLAILAILIPQLLFWFFEVYITKRHMEWYHGPFPWRPFVWIRGALYLLVLINDALAGTMLIYIQKKTQIPWKKLLGMTLFRWALPFGGFVFFLIPATLAMHHYDIIRELKFNLYLWWGGLIFGLLFFMESWAVWHHNKFFTLSKLIVRDKGIEFWTVFRMATRMQWFLTIVWGAIPVVFVLIGFWFLAIAFGIKIPILQYAATSLVMMMIMTLPIAFAGFGTTTMAWMLFYGEYGDHASIAGLTLFLPFMRSLIRAIIGVVSLKPALNELNSMKAISETQDPESSTQD